MGNCNGKAEIYSNRVQLQHNSYKYLEATIFNEEAQRTASTLESPQDSGNGLGWRPPPHPDI